MDIIIDLIVFIIRALLGDDKNKPAGQPPRSAPPKVDNAPRARVQQMQPSRGLPRSTTLTSPDPAFRNAGWCLALVVCAAILLVALLGAWALGVFPRG